MDLNQFNRTYGSLATEELLDHIIISQSKTDWRAYCLKHTIIKRTTKTVRDNFFNGKEDYGNYQGRYQQLPEPKQYYHLTLLNGKGSHIFYLKFYQEEVETFYAPKQLVTV
jgi:hypothetical protein